MSRTSVRAAIATYLGGQLAPGQDRMYVGSPVTYLTSLWTSWPREAMDDDFIAGPGGLSGAVMALHLPDSREVRRALGGGGVDGIPPGGFKRVDYTLILDSYFLSRQDRAEDAMADHDIYCDALIAWIRLDHTFGTGGRTLDTVWSAGQDDSGIQLAHDEPEVSEGRFRLHSLCRLSVSEWCAG